jgi:hypothetical protein
MKAAGVEAEVMSKGTHPNKSRNAAEQNSCGDKKPLMT